MDSKFNCTTHDNKRLRGLVFYLVKFLLDGYTQILCTCRHHRTLLCILGHLCSSFIKQLDCTINPQCYSASPSTSQVLGLGAAGLGILLVPLLNGAFHSNGISQLCRAYKSAESCSVPCAFTKAEKLWFVVIWYVTVSPEYLEVKIPHSQDLSFSFRFLLGVGFTDMTLTISVEMVKWPRIRNNLSQISFTVSSGPQTGSCHELHTHEQSAMVAISSLLLCFCGRSMDKKYCSTSHRETVEVVTETKGQLWY